MSGIRGAGFAIGTAHLHGITFGIVFGILSTVGQVIAYQFGIRPTLDYYPAARPRLTTRQVLAGLNRTVGYTAAGYVSSVVAHQRASAWAVGVTTGLMIGVVTVIFGMCTPFIEWMADHIPEKRMGVFGIALIIAGFSLQSVQYWVILFDVAVR